MSKHTPGPWMLADDKTRVITNESVPDAEIADCESGFYCSKNISECEANARLIAAAPEMLEALKAAEKRLHALWQADPNNYPQCEPGECAMIRYAINKAEEKS